MITQYNPDLNHHDDGKTERDSQGVHKEARYNRARVRRNRRKRYILILFILIACTIGIGIWGGQKNGLAIVNNGLSIVTNRVYSMLIDISMEFGFQVKNIERYGIHHAQQETIDKALSENHPIEGSSIFLLDLKAASQRLQNSPWIETIRIERHLPETIIIYIQEYQPFALWQYQRQLSVIDHKGNVCSGAEIRDFIDLPHIVGMNAENHASTLLALLNNYPIIEDNLKSAVWIGDRRWDLNLDNNKRIMLPETDVDYALSLLSDESIVGLLSDDSMIMSIDLRLPDRITVRESL